MSAERIIEIYLNSKAAMAATVVIVFMFLFRREISEKIRLLWRLGGPKGASWPRQAGLTAKLPSGKDLENLRSEIDESKREAEDLRKTKSELEQKVLELNSELENTRWALYFERVARAILLWQYRLLKMGYDSPSYSLTLREILARLRVEFPDFDQWVTKEYLDATLDDLRSSQFIDAAKPYTEDTTIRFTEISNAFVKYISDMGYVA